MDTKAKKNFDINTARWSLLWPKETALLSTLDCSTVSFCQSANGELNLKKEKADQVFYLHSESDPTKEAKKWFSELPLKNINVLYVYGVGLGYYYDAAWEWLRENPHRSLIFFEDDLEVIHHLFETERGKYILCDQQVILHYWSETPNSITGLDNFLSNFSLYEYIISSLISYEKFCSHEAAKLKGQISFFSVLSKTTTSEYSQYGLAFFNNFFRNILYLPQSYLADLLFSKFSGIPAIICGAGPSLEKNIHLLPELKDRALIFAGGTALNALNGHGVLPHFGVGIDPNPDHFTRLVMNQSFEVPFFYRTRMLHEAFRKIHGDKLYITGTGGYNVSEWFEKNLDIQGTDLNEGCNVLNFSLSIAHAMGCNPIIFVGVDLAYSEGHSYAHGLISHPIHEYKSSFRTKHTFEELLVKTDIYGQPVHTLWKWIAEAIWYSKYAMQNTDVLLINATEGGLGFPNVINMPLSLATQNYLTRHYDFGTLLHGEIQNSYPPPVATTEKIQELMMELSEGLHRCWLHCHELYAELDQALMNSDNADLVELHNKIENIEAKLLQESAYTHFLKVFSDAYLRAYGFEAIRILNDEGLVPPKEIQLKKMRFDALRFHFLKQTALINSSLIQDILSEYEEQQKAAADWSKTSKEAHEKLGGGPEKLLQPKQDEKYLAEEQMLVIEDPEIGISSKAPFNSSEERYTQNYPGGSLKSEWFYRNGVLHGPSTFYAENGDVLAKGWYISGKQEGKAWSYYSSGALHSLQRYRNGQREGKQQYFYSDGSPKTILNYTNGQLNGEILLYYPNGRPERSIHFVQGKRNGIERIWDEKGLVIIEAHYHNDKPVGISRKWHPNGTLGKEVIFDEQSHGCIINRWTPNGIPIEKEELFEDDYFGKVSKHTEQLTDSLEEVFNQFKRVIPALSDKIDESTQSKTTIKTLTKDGLEKNIEDLQQEMDRLRGLSKELKIESNLDADNTLEPLWKNPSTQKEVEKQLDDLKTVMSKEITNIEKELKNVMDQLFHKLDKPTDKDDKI